MTNCIKKLCLAKKRKDNEWYTPIHTVEQIFSLIPEGILKNKKIYCPCDSDKSEFVKFLLKEENQKKFGYAQVYFTSDQWQTHDDMFDKCDFVITNPPFTGIKKFIDYVHSKGKQFILICPISVCWHHFENIKNGKFFFNRLTAYECDFFKRPDGQMIRCSTVGIISTVRMNCIFPDSKIQKYVKRQKKFKDLDLKKFDGTDIYNVDCICDVPIDYYGVIGVPATNIMMANSWYRQFYDILGLVENPIVDGKSKFVRVKIQRKPGK